MTCAPPPHTHTQNTLYELSLVEGMGFQREVLGAEEEAAAAGAAAGTHTSGGQVGMQQQPGAH